MGKNYILLSIASKENLAFPSVMNVDNKSQQYNDSFDFATSRNRKYFYITLELLPVP